VIDFLAPAAAALAILLGGLIKGAIGLGAPLVAVPVIAAIYGVKTAIAVMTVPLIVSNIWQIWTYRATIEGRPMLKRLLAGCIAGVVAGTFLLGVLPEAWLGLALAIMLFVYLGLASSRPGWTLAQPIAEKMAVPIGLVTGTLQGAAGLSTPVGATFIHAQRLGREAQVFAASAMFFTLSATQILALASLDLMTMELAALSVAALVPIMLGVWLGQYLGARVSRKTFERLTLLVILVMALGLLAQSVPEL
jgi:uncharacterized membrane protein YfcA